jgi:putative aldouronate transport system substrate-binding protein
MKQKYRQRMARLLVVPLTLILILAACSSNETNSGTPENSSSPSSTASATENTAEDLPEVKLVMHTLVPEQQDQENVFKKANEIIKSKINATVEFHYHGFGTYNDKMNVTIASGEPFDIAFTSNWSNDYVQGVNKGAYLALDDLLPTYGKSLMTDIDSKYWDAVRLNGSIYAVPNMQIQARSVGVWFQKDLLDQVGMTMDQLNTVDEIEAYMKAAYEKAGVQGSSLELMNYASHFAALHEAKVPGVIDIQDGELKVFNQFESEEWLTMIKKNREWFEQGLLSKEVDADWDAQMKAKKYSWGWEGTYKPGGDVEMTNRVGWTYVAKPLTEPTTSSANVRSTMYGVSANSKHPERAVMLLDLINSDKELYNLLVFGIEGTHYNKVSDNRVEPIEGSTYNTGAAWALGNTFNSYLLPGQPDDVWEQTKKLNAEAELSPISGFVFNTEPVKVEVANCQKVYEEFSLLAGGMLDPEKSQAPFIEKLKKAGADKIIAEMQKQLDAYKAQNG